MLPSYKIFGLFYMLLLLESSLPKTVKVQTFRTIVCDSVSAVILCNQGHIKVLTADYGRWNVTTCPDKSYIPADYFTGCRTGYVAKKVVTTACEEKPTCTIKSTVSFMNSGIDPCAGTYKYVNMTYQCLPAKKKAK